MVGPKFAKAFDVPTPVSLQLSSHRRPVHELHARMRHPLMSRLAGMFLEGAGSICHDENIIALLDQTQRRECDADFGENTTTLSLGSIPSWSGSSGLV